MRRLALIALLTWIASACTLDINIGIDLEDNGSGSVAVEVLADEEFHQLYQLTDRDFEDLIASRGNDVGLKFDVTPGTTIRYSAASSEVPAETLAGILEGLAPGIGEITVSRSESDLQFDGVLSPLPSISDVAPYFVDTDPSQFEDDVNVTVRMTIPGEVSTSTGTKTGSEEFTWSIPFSDSETRILARSVLVAEGSSVPWTLVILLVTVTVSIGFLVAIRSRLAPSEDPATPMRSVPEPKSTAPEDQPVATDDTPPEDQAVGPPAEPESPRSG